MNILLVDDDQNSLVEMENSLTGPDLLIFKAESGPEALRFTLRHQFALILIDTSMPVLDGFETAFLIREYGKNRQTPIIFISQRESFKEDVKKGFSTGIVDFVIKPIIPQVLKSKVDIYINSLRERRAPNQ